MKLRQRLAGATHLAMKALVAPARDLLHGLERILERGPRALAALLAGALAGWWLYVPAHELLHAVGCLAAGGRVERLEVAPLFGGTLLARVVPFVVAGGAGAGRLTEFDTRGSDLVYLATDLLPFVLTVFPGVWALRAAALRRRAAWYGFSLPLAFAPFLALGGDAYEIGSILVTAQGRFATPGIVDLVRGDDVVAVFAAIRAAGPARPAATSAAVLAACVGAAWAWGTYLAGRCVAVRLERVRGAANGGEASNASAA